MDITQFDAAISKLPRRRVGFYPTPFHALPNLSAAYGRNFFLKREDLAGPSAISGSKMRLAEFILGRALENGVTHVITQGAYLTNSGLQFAAACLSAGITPILVLTRNVPRHGELGEFRGNYLLNKTMGVETHVINISGNEWHAPNEAARVTDTIAARKAELDAQGHKVLVVGAGGAHPDGYIAHAVTLREILEQSDAAGVELDHVYHTIGTGTALPGMLAAKLSLGHPVKLRSIAIQRLDDENRMNRGVIVERTKAVLATLGAPVPDDATIRAEIDIDQRFIGEEYAVASPESTAAIRELARAEGVFVGPVYTGKGLAGMLDHARSGQLPANSNVAFLHTGDTGNLFEIPQVVGPITG
ncbi:1-aminocyclopropane-1-carboxylate deaminase/D-cysteine desulfhydrase [Streptomyces sp. NBC_00588]|jgi:1-aminocyclopropane-1-carboxylate deaminase/D-cysteine desulfhydrase-like pyridoxal-dependent ACC family enzyme|uniref:1-aminocyclopropane-1-carboxylate deaminase/D-cysteine desulfhydrase n=1 Tax=Streptomyces sp. NBC_00588 TaxID=2975784 RepID=UPI002E820AA7|nr:pyridoxal-phosphate dependent enzyme [Streptomyces sp. NBC_00588]WUB33414.1 pyridoxal-phosphate dependent enzyme [Streptomyces sp. NBC_00588]WUB41355.1 pyridoxal-phosphate dependent enzyme [Streptomyces sp. NBC_00588]